MIPGVVASMALSRKATLRFKGVATLSLGGNVQVFQDNGDSYSEVFNLVDSTVRHIQLVANDLMLGHSSKITVYSWNGTTFVNTWSSTGTIYGTFPNSTSTISYDGARIMWNESNTTGIVTRQSDGSYVADASLTTANAAGLATNGDGTILLEKRAGNAPVRQARRLSDETWRNFANIGSNIFGAQGQIVMSQFVNVDHLYAAAMSTSSPYVVLYRILPIQDDFARLANLSNIPPSTWNIKGIAISHDGEYVAMGYQAGTTANGGVRIHQRSAGSAFNTIRLDTGSLASGHILDVTMSSDGTKLFAARAFNNPYDGNVWVWTRTGTTWTKTTSIDTAGSSFNKANNSYKLISAN